MARQVFLPLAPVSMSSSLPSGSRRSARRKWLLAAAPALFFVACVSADRITGLKPHDNAALDIGSTSGGVVISQIYGAGGNSGALLKNDYVELHNAGSTTVALTGWSLQYASATGTGLFSPTALSGSIAPGGYFLVKLAGGSVGADLPVTADLTPLSALNLSGTTGKIALVDQTAGIGCNGGSAPCSDVQAAHIIDLVGFGGANYYEGAAAAPAPSTTTAIFRKLDGNQDSGDNSNDFVAGAPNPRNSASPPVIGEPVVVGALDHVTVTGGASTVPVGSSIQFTATGRDAVGTAIPSATVTWTSSDPTLASVDNTGNVTGLSASATPVTLTATAVDGTITKSATTSITVVVPAPVATVTVSPATWDLKVGQTKTFSATMLDADGKATSSTITWSSADPAIAAIDPSSGLLTGKSEGSTTISATTANGKAGSAAVTVSSASNVTLSSGKTQLALGMQTQFFVGGTDASGNSVTSVVFSTSDPTIITVDQHGIVSGRTLGSAKLIATAPDGSVGSKTITVYLAAGATGIRLGHNTEFGEPKDADPSDDFLIRRAQYTVSYNPRRGGANWVSWNVDITHIGNSGRCTGTCYSADTVLVNAGLPAYTTADWVSNSPGVVGYDRGHMAPSADWTSSEADNNTTFFLTNFVPQRHDMNAGPWERLEVALRDSVSAGREAYVIAGPIFAKGVAPRTLLDLGKIAIPDSTWKIAVITPAGTGINPDGSLPPNSTVLAVNMPNITGIIDDGFEKYLTTVSKLEQSTGYNFLALLAESTQCRVEGRNCAPTARLTGPTSGDEGQALSFDASTSSDPDAGNTISYQWSIDGVAVGTGATLSRTFADDGVYMVQLVVVDNNGASNTATQTVTIHNVTPVVAGFGGVTLLQGESYSAAGSFTDPGADTWSAAVNYGDASASSPLSLSGKSFQLAHQYLAAGTFTVTVAVSDDDGATGSAQAVVNVLSPVEGVRVLAGMTNVLSGVNVSSLQAKLDAAAKQLAIGNGTAAPNPLGAFQNELRAMVISGRVSPGDAAPLLDYAERVIGSIQ